MEVAGAAWRIFGQVDLVPKWLKSIGYLWRHISLSRPEWLPCRIHGKSSGRIGQQDLRFVRRGVSYCSAVAGGFLALPSPSLGVSSLDLGRSRKVSGPFLLVFDLLVSCPPAVRRPNLFRCRPVGPQLLHRDRGEAVGQ